MKKKVIFISSSGSHFIQIWKLSKYLPNTNQVWVVKKDNLTDGLLKNKKRTYAYFPEHRNIFNLFRNFFLAIRILLEEKPSIIVSTGAGVAIPFFLIAKLFGIKTVFIEVFILIKKPSLTGKILYYISDMFFIQNKKMNKNFPKAIYKGSLL